MNRCICFGKHVLFAHFVSQHESLCVALDQHRLPQRVCSLSRTLTADRTALSSFCHRIHKCWNKVRSFPLSVPACQISFKCNHQMISSCKVLVCNVLLLSEYHHGIFWILPRTQKVWADNFTLVRNPNSKSPNGLQVQMVDGNDFSERKGGAMLSPTMAVMLPVCKLCALICLYNSPCCTNTGRAAVGLVLESTGPAAVRPGNTAENITD